MLSVLTGEGWRSVDPYDIVAVVRSDDDEPGSMYVSAVLIMVGGAEVAVSSGPTP